MEAKGRSREFVTARAWMDLSNMMRLYEKNGLEIDDELVSQYLQTASIASDFYVYLRLFSSYSADYRIEDILGGKADESLREKAAHAGFDERAALAGLLIDTLAAHAESDVEQEHELAELRAALVRAKEEPDPAATLSREADEHASRLEADAARYRNDVLARSVEHGAIESLRAWAAKLGGGGASLRDIAASFNERLGEHKRQGAIIETELTSALDFMDAAWGEGNEMTVALNEMTMNKTLSAFIAKHGCDAYYNHSETLMLDARAERLAERLAQLEA